MEEKSKFIIIALVGVLAISIFVNLQVHNSRRAIERERDEIKREKDLLFRKIEEEKNVQHGLTEKVSSLNQDINKLNKEIDRIFKEKEEFQKKYELLVKEKDEFADRIKRQEAQQQIQPKVEVEKVPESQDAYWARLLRSKADLEVQLDKLRVELKTTQINNEYLQREKSNLELELNSLAQEKKTLGQEIEYHQKQIDTLTAEFVREKNAARQYQESLKFVKGENSILKRQLKTLNNYKLSLENKLAQYQEEKSRLEKRFNEMSTILEDRVGDIKDKIETIRSGGGVEISKPSQESPEEKRSVELPPIVVRPQTEAVGAEEEKIMSVPMTGKVVAVDKDNNFIIIDLGEDSGLRTGHSFQVYRKDELIGIIEVTQVRKKIAACDIKKEIMKIKVGDTIIIRN